jgi:hypothetical protein
MKDLNKNVAVTEHVDDTGEAKKAVVEVRNVRSAALAQAIAEDDAKPFRKSFRHLYLCLLVAYMCSSTNGFDANTFGKSTRFRYRMTCAAPNMVIV